jgi:hypothetical protein
VDALVALSVSLLALVGGLVATGLTWIARSVLRNRRKARAVAGLAAQLRARERRVQSSRRVIVDELLARAEAEGRPVRLNWGDPT